MRYCTLREDPVFQTREQRSNNHTIPIAPKIGFKAAWDRLTGKTSSENGRPESLGSGWNSINLSNGLSFTLNFLT